MFSGVTKRKLETSSGVAMSSFILSWIGGLIEVRLGEIEKAVRRGGNALLRVA